MAALTATFTPEAMTASDPAYFKGQAIVLYEGTFDGVVAIEAKASNSDDYVVLEETKRSGAATFQLSCPDGTVAYRLTCPFMASGECNAYMGQEEIAV